MGELAGHTVTMRQTTFWCAQCRQPTDFYPTRRERQRDLIKNARRLGWRNRRGKGWVCPECAVRR